MRALGLLAVASLLAAGCGPARVGAGGVTIRLPAGWHSLPQPAAAPTSGVVDPVVRIVASSSPLSVRALGCQIASYAFSRRGVALVVVEWRRRYPRTRWPRRPSTFTTRTLPLDPPPAIECFDGPGGSAQFADHGRRFGAYVLLGRDAPAVLAARARRALDTLHVEAARQ